MGQVEREQTTDVAQEHGALVGGLKGHLLVILAGGDDVAGGGMGTGDQVVPEQHGQQGPGQGVEGGPGKTAEVHGGGQAFGVVEGAALDLGDPDGHRRRLGVDRAAVGADEAVEMPLAAEDPVEEVAVLAGRDPVDQVVRAHHGADPALLHGRREGGEIDLVERPLGDDRVVLAGGPVDLLVVDGEVLHDRDHPVGLDALDQRYGQ